MLYNLDIVILLLLMNSDMIVGINGRYNCLLRDSRGVFVFDGRT